MAKLKVGLIGYGTVGSGVARYLYQRDSFMKNKYEINFHLKTIADRSIHKKNTRGLKNTQLTKNFSDVLDDKDIDVVIELIGGLHPAKEIVLAALKNGKHVVTANKELLAHFGQELFAEANRRKRNIFFESAVGAGIPIIRTINEGMAGNKFQRIYGIINGTCNYILSQMTEKDLSFTKALELAQRKGFAESNPTLDINGMDTTHKLAILVQLAFGKYIPVDKIYTEGITHISHTDIEHAESLNLAIKLLAIAKNVNNELDVRVHPTLISKDHPLAWVDSNYNAIYFHTDPLGEVMISGEGAGQKSAAAGVMSDLINLATQYGQFSPVQGKLFQETSKMNICKIDEVKTRFYLRFMATDKPGVLAQITNILGKHSVSINSVTQKIHDRSSAVPVVMLTDYVTEKLLRSALEKIYQLTIVKSRPVAIRMENLK